MKGKNLESDFGGLDFGGQGPHGDPLWAGSCQWLLVVLIQRGMTMLTKMITPRGDLTKYHFTSCYSWLRRRAEQQRRCLPSWSCLSREGEKTAFPLSGFANLTFTFMSAFPFMSLFSKNDNWLHFFAISHHLHCLDSKSRADWSKRKTEGRTLSPFSKQSTLAIWENIQAIDALLKKHNLPSIPWDLYELDFWKRNYTTVYSSCGVNPHPVLLGYICNMHWNWYCFTSVVEAFGDKTKPSSSSCQAAQARSCQIPSLWYVWVVGSNRN